MPFTTKHFENFFKLLPLSDDEKTSEKSWFVDIKSIKDENKYDLKAVNPNIKEKEIPKPDTLIKIIEDSQIKINESLKRLKEIG